MAIFIPIFEMNDFNNQVDFLINSNNDPKYIQLHIKKYGLFKYDDFHYMPKKCQFCTNEDHSKHKNSYAKNILKKYFYE